jgi:hypothetical protein
MKSPSIKPQKSNDDAKEGEDVTPLSLRIFIGGINPLNGLTSQMVLDRLPQTGISNVHLGETYLHGTVQDAAQRALVQRTLHNCKWKQCKLSVENAKEDFLTRLARERSTETTSSSTLTKTTSSHETPITDGAIATPVVAAIAAIAADAAAATKDSSSLEPRRHWRVKRRFGAPVVLVDTHPKVVSNWTELRINRSKKHYQNRAIHLKFKDNDDDDDNDAVTSGQEELSQEGDEDSDASASSQQGGSEASSHNDSSSHADSSHDPPNRSDKKNTAMPTDTYIWSSSDDESSSSASDDDDAVVDELANAAPVPGNSKSSHVHEPEYDDEEDSVDDAVASVSSEESEQGSTGSGTKNDTVDNHDVETIDLNKDMEMNESVLAQLFPGAFPAVDTTSSSKPPEEQNKKKRKAATTMVRYDPTDQSAQAKYELSEDEDDNELATTAQVTTQATKISTGDEEEESETTAMDAEETNAKTTQQDSGPPPDAYVYEQGQLESVFKESREQEVTTLRSPPGAFSFGFDLPALPPDSTIDTTTSTVSIPLEKPENEPVHAPEKDVSQLVEDTTESIGPDTVPVAKRGPTLFEFPSEELLDSLTSKFFYGFDDGKRIVENLEEWRNDPTVRESWLQRRAVLTLDWKRKRKAALSQRKQRDEKHRMSRPRPSR